MLGKERASLGTVYIPWLGAAILYEQKTPLCKSESSTRRRFVVGEKACCILCDVEPRPTR
jgi:hypothetical protein